MDYLFTSESVTSGHPDKLCDFISDSILDACLELDPNARVAVEVFVKGLDADKNFDERSYIIIGGEITMNKEIDIDFEEIARNCAIEVGYTDVNVGMDAADDNSCKVILLISQQSEEIDQGVTEGVGLDLEQGAGDQGIIFGFACDESEKFEATNGTFMPLPILLAHKITLEMTKKRKIGVLNWARPDGKSQVTIRYSQQGEPICVDTIVIAIQHDDMIGSLFKTEIEEREFIIAEVKKHIIEPVIPSELLHNDIKLIVNGTGRFCKGGPHADAGLTGRKLIVDTYGGFGRHGGGAFSGKDPSKVDRSAAYAARWVAKHIVASGITKYFEIQISYSIGVAEPISINVNLGQNGNEIERSKIRKIVTEIFDFRPLSIIEKLNLRSTRYSITSSGGHFGRTAEEGYFPWENLDQEIIRKIRELYYEENY
ncbi:MAG: methionine adenosyltransferase [Euryarchaeota archaeon]|nr:methionine adenosyltransferase [Euryarchaeota archaeon]